MTTSPQTKNILVAPLNWGLGHATRCIPLIRALLAQRFKPIIASDGAALDFLKKEFPELTFLELPSYQIAYAKKGKNLKWKLLVQSPKIVKVVYREHQLVNRWVAEHLLCGIISDNRLGCYSAKIPSVYLTHQLRVLSGNTTWFSTKIHQFFIKKYTECWVPDIDATVNLSGKMGHTQLKNIPIKYLGVLSRFSKKESTLQNHLLVLISGPEPQRTLLEKKLLQALQNYPEKTILIQGKVAEKQTIETPNNNLTIYNYMTSAELENTINGSEMVLCRSGYSSIMDLVCLEKKAFLTPTPGQYEQEYVAQHMKQQGFFNFAQQETFSIDDLQTTTAFQKIALKQETAWEKLFAIF